MDLSPPSAQALRHAAVWARWYEASLRVLYVAPPPQAYVEATGQPVVLPGPPPETVRADVLQFVTATLSDAPVVAVNVRHGDAVTVIQHEAARWPHSLLVMGTHGATGFDRLLLGSTTERVAHGTACPLLVVPPHEQTGPAAGPDLTRIVCAVDFHPSALAGLRYALSLAQESRARLELVTVLERPRHSEVLAGWPRASAERDDDVRENLLQALRERVPGDARLWAEVQERVLTGPPAEVLLAHARDIDAGLIVLGTGDRRHLHALWLGSTTGRIVRTAQCPVLIVPGPRRVSFAHAKSLPRRAWEAELDRLSLAHRGEPATMAVIREDLGTQRQVSDMPFEGVTADLHDEGGEVAVMLAQADGTRFTHVIADPQDVRLGVRSNRHDVELYVVGGDGSTTQLAVGGHRLSAIADRGSS